jgi:hypothetical protein
MLMTLPALRGNTIAAPIRLSTSQPLNNAFKGKLHLCKCFKSDLRYNICSGWILNAAGWLRLVIEKIFSDA